MNLHENINNVNILLNLVCPICYDSVGSHTVEDYADCLHLSTRLMPVRHTLTQEIDREPLISGRYARNIPRIRRGILVNVVF